MDRSFTWRFSCRFWPGLTTWSWWCWRLRVWILPFWARFIFIVEVIFAFWFQTCRFGTHLPIFDRWYQRKTRFRAFYDLSTHLHIQCHWGIHTILYRGAYCSSTGHCRLRRMRNDTRHGLTFCLRPMSLRIFTHLNRCRSCRELWVFLRHVSSWCRWRVASCLHTLCRWRIRTCQSHVVRVREFGVTIIWEVIRRLPFWLISLEACFL